MKNYINLETLKKIVEIKKDSKISVVLNNLYADVDTQLLGAQIDMATIRLKPFSDPHSLKFRLPHINYLQEQIVLHLFLFQQFFSMFPS